MLHKVGLLPAGNFQQVPFAYTMFKRTDDLGWEQSTEFKNSLLRRCPNRIYWRLVRPQLILGTIG
jgi:hypothetical protein